MSDLSALTKAYEVETRHRWRQSGVFLATCLGLLVIYGMVPLPGGANYVVACMVAVTFVAGMRIGWAV